MLGLGKFQYNGEPTGYAPPRVTAEVLRTKMMPEYAIDTRLPGIIDAVREVVNVQAANGETVTVAVDENGEVIAAEAQPNWLPLALAAGAAYFFIA